jgi:glutaredoxin-related protein
MELLLRQRHEAFDCRIKQKARVSLQTQQQYYYYFFNFMLDGNIAIWLFGYTTLHTFPQVLMKYKFESGYPVMCGFSLWTSGMRDKSKSVSWCTKKGPAENGPMNWASNQLLNEGCISLTFSNINVTDSKYTLMDCATVQNFVCEVYTESIYY